MSGGVANPGRVPPWRPVAARLPDEDDRSMAERQAAAINKAWAGFGVDAGARIERVDSPDPSLRGWRVVSNLIGGLPPRAV